MYTKLTLDAAGKLPAGYDACGNGFDGMTLKALGLDREETLAYIASHKPTYVQFEEYILEKNGGTLPKEAIEAHNAAVRGYNHTDEYGSSLRAATGVKDASVKDAVTLNLLEDLHELHAHVTN